MTENERYLYDRFLISIKSGFLSLDDIIDETLETIEDEAWENEISEEWVRENVTREFEKHVAKSKTWQHPTDTERLHKVFDNICKQKIVALHNAGYTQSDALFDVKDVWEDLEDNDIHPIGYCYYHGQDLERVIETDILCIGYYGAKENNDKEAIQIGNKITTALRDEGFSVKWNAAASKRIEIEDFNWQNVFTSDEDVDEKWGYDRVLLMMEEQ